MTFFGGATPEPGTYDFYFSTTNVSPTTLFSTFANNLGTAPVLFAHMVTDGTSPGSVWTIHGSPFLFDPGTGFANLILDIQMSFTVFGGGVGGFTAGFDDNTNRVFGTGATGAVQAAPHPFGLRTQFNGRVGDITGAPEPPAYCSCQPALSQSPGSRVGGRSGHGNRHRGSQLDAVFEPFVQGGSDGRGAARGIGLGLAISLELAQAMGGTLTATSALGKGTSFTLLLPIGAASL